MRDRQIIERQAQMARLDRPPNFYLDDDQGALSSTAKPTPLVFVACFALRAGLYRNSQYKYFEIRLTDSTCLSRCILTSNQTLLIVGKFSKQNGFIFIFLSLLQFLDGLAHVH